MNTTNRWSQIEITVIQVFFMIKWSAVVIHRDLFRLSSCTFVSIAVNFAFIKVIFHCVVRSHGNRTTA